MNDDTLHPQDSLQIINNMIHTAKNRLADDGFFLIFWGWLVLACAVINYTSIKLHSDLGNWVWALFLPAGGIISIIIGYRENKIKKVKTYIDSYLGYLWSAFLIGMFITLIFLPNYGLKPTYFSLMILYGIATFITGGMLNFKPLIIGSLFSFAFAILAAFLSDAEQLLCISGSLFCSYIIPGHLLRSAFRSQHV